MKLTPKQHEFCQAVFLGMSQADAYRKAYNADGMSDTAIRVEASRLMDNPNITLTLEELRKPIIMANEVTVQSLMDELEEARVMASTQEKPQATAMVAATMGKAKLAGLIRESVDVTLSVEEKRSLKISFGEALRGSLGDEPYPQQDSEGIKRT